ncbi:unnamed protein product [Agarophyton chilense]
MTSSTFVQPPFEGPEKKLSAIFRPHPNHPSASLRSIPRQTIETILRAASCSVLSVRHNAHFDAYLLSESSLFVSDHTFTIKTCGTTALLNALSPMFHTAALLHLRPVSLSFSRVRYAFPNAQPYPHDCFENEVTFIDHALQACAVKFEKFVQTTSNWFLYHARFQHANRHEQNAHRNTLDIYMFDLDDQYLSNFQYEKRQQLIGNDEPDGVTKQSGISRFVHDYDVVDAFNFEPCGYSMNALNSLTYCTVHVTPEPACSYVSYEISGDLPNISLLVAKIVRLFKPRSFTLSLLGGGLEEHDQCNKVANRIQADFACTWPLCRTKVGDFYASVCSFRARTHEVQLSATEVGEVDSVAFQVGKQFGAVAVDEGVSGVELARQVLSKNGGVGGGGATLMVDLCRVEREMREVRSAVGRDVELRYLVKVNGARGLCALINEAGAMFEASDEMDVIALESVGVCREKIALVSTVVCEELIGRVGAVAVYSGGTVVEMAARHGVSVEIRVVDGIVSEIEGVVEDVVAWGARVSGVGFDGRVEGAVAKSVLERVCNAVGGGEGMRVVLGEVGDGAGCLREEEVAKMVAKMDGEMDGKRVVATVGTRVVREAVSARLEIVGRKRREKGPTLYYVSDGAYGMLNEVMMGGKVRVCGAVRADDKDTGTARHAVVFGPTCDSLDVVWSGAVCEMHVGDHVVVEALGAVGGATRFNGLGARTLELYFVRHSAL